MVVRVVAVSGGVCVGVRSSGGGGVELTVGVVGGEVVDVGILVEGSGGGGCGGGLRFRLKRPRLFSLRRAILFLCDCCGGVSAAGGDGGVGVVSEGGSADFLLKFGGQHA